MVVQINNIKALDGLKWDVMVVPLIDMNNIVYKAGKDWVDELSDQYLQKLREEELEFGRTDKR